MSALNSKHMSVDVCGGWLSGSHCASWPKMLIALVPQLPSDAWWFEQPTTVIAVKQWSWANCLLTVVVARPT